MATPTPSKRSNTDTQPEYSPPHRPKGAYAVPGGGYMLPPKKQHSTTGGVQIRPVHRDEPDIELLMAAIVDLVTDDLPPEEKKAFDRMLKNRREAQ